MAGEWRFNPSVHRAKGDRLVRARVLPICDNSLISLHCALVITEDPTFLHADSDDFNQTEWIVMLIRVFSRLMVYSCRGSHISPISPRICFSFSLEASPDICVIVV